MSPFQGSIFSILSFSHYLATMIGIGQYHSLEILRETSVGLYLGDDSGEDILLPNKYCPAKFDIGDEIEVFVYRDFAERKVATTLTPGILLHEFALLEVVDVTDVGAFLDWGLEKHLLVPFSEQRDKMEVGNWYLVYLDLDTKTDRLYGSNKIEQFLQNQELTVSEGDEVELLVYRKSDLGYSVVVNQVHEGLVFQNTVFSGLRTGDMIHGYVQKIRPGNKLDISLQQTGYQNVNQENADGIFYLLERQGGFLPFTDKTPPEDIYATFGMSKKAFKKAIGALYKARRIEMRDDGIALPGK